MTSYHSLYSRKDFEVALTKDRKGVVVLCHLKDKDNEYVRAQVASYRARGYAVQMVTQDKGARKGARR